MNMKLQEIDVTTRDYVPGKIIVFMVLLIHTRFPLMSCNHALHGHVLKFDWLKVIKTLEIFRLICTTRVMGF